MRVVSGSLRGRIIKPVPGLNTRPTADKVKESVFNALGQYFDGGTVLDLYAGSGNLGIEAISRGANKCIFVDIDFNANKIIKENVTSLKIEDKCKVYKLEAFKALEFLSNDYKFDLVFLDPPYKKQRINEIIEILENKNMLNDNALIIAECAKEDQLIESYKNIYFLKQYIYGITKITIYEKRGVLNE